VTANAAMAPTMRRIQAKLKPQIMNILVQ